MAEPPRRAAPAGRWRSACCSAASRGNLTDRIVRQPEPFHGHVVDFLMLPNWPVFNIADICINVAAGLIILQTFRGVALDGSRDADHRPTPRRRRPERPLMTSHAEQRTVFVPDGLAGERVDAAMARMFGFSRTKAADLIAQGLVQVDGRDRRQERPGPRRRRCSTSRSRPRRDPLEVVPEIVEGIRIIHDDDAIVVIDKPVGVAVHPSPGWCGPDRRRPPRRCRLPDLHQRCQRAAGHRPAPRRRHQRRDGDLQVRARLLRAQERLPPPHGRQDLPRARAGPPRPAGRHRRRARSGATPHHDYKFAVMADGRHSITHYETLEAHRFASLLEVHLETGRTHQIRVHMSALKHPCVGDLTYGADPTLSKRLGLERQWLHAMRLGFEHPETGDYVSYESTYPDDLAHALEVIRDEH